MRFRRDGLRQHLARFSINVESMRTEVNVCFLLQRTRGIIPQELAGRRDISSQDKSLYRKVYPGDIVYNTMRMWQGVSGVSNLSGIVSPAYTICAPREGTDPWLLASILKHPRYVTVFRSYSQGMVSDTWNLRFSSFARIPVILPIALTEQRRIAEILDALASQVLTLQRSVEKRKRIRAGLLADSLRPISLMSPPPGWQRVSLGEVVPSVDYGISYPLTD